MGVYSGKPCGQECDHFRNNAAGDWIRVANILCDAMVRGLSPRDLPPCSTDPSFIYATSLHVFSLGLIGKLQLCGIALPTDAIEKFTALANAWSKGARVSAPEVLTTSSLASIQANRIQMDAIARLTSRPVPGPGKPPGEDADRSPQPGSTSVKSSGDESPQPGPVAPQSLDSRAVGFAHEMLAKGEGINVAEIARWLGCERTKLYDLPGFGALVKQDRASREAARRRRPRGTRDRETRSVEAWSEDE